MSRKEKNQDVRTTAAFALEEITRKHFGEDHAKWQEWWAENKNKQLASPGQ